MNISHERVVEEMTSAVLAFLNGRLRNQWLTDSNGIVDLYVRKGVHAVNGQLLHTFDIASMTIHADHRNKSIGQRIIDNIHNQHDREATYIESLLNPRFYAHLLDEYSFGQ